MLDKLYRRYRYKKITCVNNFILDYNIIWWIFKTIFKEYKSLFRFNFSIRKILIPICILNYPYNLTIRILWLNKHCSEWNLPLHWIFNHSITRRFKKLKHWKKKSVSGDRFYEMKMRLGWNRSEGCNNRLHVGTKTCKECRRTSFLSLIL